MISRVRTRARRADERGAAAVFVLAMSVVLLVCAGLVVDGGLAINARMRVADDAEQAARVAADSIDIDQLRDGGAIVIDEGVAKRRAGDYLAGRGYTSEQYSIRVDGGSVDVSVQDTTETSLLKLINIDTYQVNAGATAVPETDTDNDLAVD